MSASVTPQDPQLMTPENQIRRTLNEVTTESEPSAELAIRREDSAASLIRCLLTDSQESQPSPISPASSNLSFKTLSPAKDSEHETTVQDESQSSQPDESQSSQQSDESQPSQQQPKKSQPSQQQPDESQSSQEQQSDHSHATDLVEHAKYASDLIHKSKNRVLMHSRKETPRLWRHKLDARVAICLTSAVDDKTRLATTGIVWTLDNRDVEVVFIATLGWKDGAKLGNKRSHKVVPFGSFCVFVRNAALMGCDLAFQQLVRIDAKDFFSFGTPKQYVNRTHLAREIELTKSFFSSCGPDIEEWQQIKLLQLGVKRVKRIKGPVKRSRRLLEMKKNQEDADIERKNMEYKERKIREEKRARDEERKREAEERKKEAQRLKQEELQRARVQKKIEEAQRRAVRLEAQRRRRLISTEVKNAISKIEKQLHQKMQKELDKKLKTVSNSMEQITEGLTSRLEDLSEEFDRMGSKIRSLDKCNRGNTKRMKKNADSLGDVKDKGKTLREDHQKLREDHDKLVTRLVKEKKVVDRLHKQLINADSRLAKEYEKTKVLVKKLSKRKRKKSSLENNSPPATRVVSPLPPQPPQPAQMMQWNVSGQTPQRFVPRADTPRPSNVRQQQPQQYVSPIYASRNLLR